MKRLHNKIPKHKLYTEAFCGRVAVLFAKRPNDGEVINDMHGYNKLLLDG